MKFLCAAVLLLSFACKLPVSAETILWTKDVITGNSDITYMVGTDGSCVIHTKYEGLSLDYLWIGRDGNEIADVTPTHDRGKLKYVSKDEFVLHTYDIDEQNVIKGKYLELFQVSSGNQIKHTVIAAPSVTSILGIYTSLNFNYPYFLVTTPMGTGESTYYTFTFYDLTDETVTEVVGDAVTGIKGNNLQVRWKTVANAKYKVQKSPDLTTWTDYSEIIDGNGSTMVINIPVDEESGQVYARVVKI